MLILTRTHSCMYSDISSHMRSDTYTLTKKLRGMLWANPPSFIWCWHIYWILLACILIRYLQAQDDTETWHCLLCLSFLPGELSGKISGGWGANSSGDVSGDSWLATWNFLISHKRKRSDKISFANNTEKGQPWTIPLLWTCSPQFIGSFFVPCKYLNYMPMGVLPWGKAATGSTAFWDIAVMADLSDLPIWHHHASNGNGSKLGIPNSKSDEFNHHFPIKAAMNCRRT